MGTSKRRRFWKNRKGKVGDGIDFPMVKEWRPPYWFEFLFGCVATFVLGIAAAWAYDHMPTRHMPTPSVMERQTDGIALPRCRGIIDADAEVVGRVDELKFVDRGHPLPHSNNR